MDFKEYQVEGSDTKIVLKRGHIHEQSCDAMLNWSNAEFRGGPAPFYRIHKAAGPQLFSNVLRYQANKMTAFSDGDCIATIPGELDCRVVLHVVVPNYKGLYMRTFMNIAETIKVYKKDNLCKNLTMYVNEMPDVIIEGIKKFLLDIGLDTITIMFLTDNEFKAIDKQIKLIERKLSFEDMVWNGFYEFLIYLSRWEKPLKIFYKLRYLRGKNIASE